MKPVVTARRASKPLRTVVALMLAVGGTPVVALAPLSTPAIDTSHERPVQLRDTGTATGGASRNLAAAREPAGTDNPATAAMIAKGPVNGFDWWTGFRDSTLNLLEQMARDRPRHPGAGATDPTQGRGDERDIAASLASAYAQARVLRIRLGAAQAVLLTTRRRVELFASQARTAGAHETEATQRATAIAERAENAALDFEATLDRRMNEIAALSGMDSAQLRVVLEPSLASSQLPTFGAAVPMRLPAHVVRGRADVRSLEVSLRRERARSVGQYRMAEYAAALAGWIEPNGDTAADDASGDVVARAKAEAGAALYRLARQQQAAAMNYQLSQLRRAELDTVLQRQQLGEAGADEVLEKHLLVLIEHDRLAAAVGAVADSWIALNAATGGLAAVAAGGHPVQSQAAGTARQP